MNPNQWIALTNFYTRPLPQKMDILLAQREALFQRQHELLARGAALAHQMHDLVERQTAYELQWHLFWQKLRRAALAEQKDEAQPVGPVYNSPEGLWCSSR